MAFGRTIVICYENCARAFDFMTTQLAMGKSVDPVGSEKIYEVASEIARPSCPSTHSNVWQGRQKLANKPLRVRLNAAGDECCQLPVSPKGHTAHTHSVLSSNFRSKRYRAL